LRRSDRHAERDTLIRSTLLFWLSVVEPIRSRFIFAKTVGTSRTGTYRF
jgi:hypothetical protein